MYAPTMNCDSDEDEVYIIPSPSTFPRICHNNNLSWLADVAETIDLGHLEPVAPRLWMKAKVNIDGTRGFYCCLLFDGFITDAADGQRLLHQVTSHMTILHIKNCEIGEPPALVPGVQNLINSLSQQPFVVGRWIGLDFQEDANVHRRVLLPVLVDWSAHLWRIRNELLRSVEVSAQTRGVDHRREFHVSLDPWHL